jgi:hypothetical protein
MIGKIMKQKVESMEYKDYLKLLGVDKNASNETIRKHLGIG